MCGLNSPELAFNLNIVQQQHLYKTGITTASICCKGHQTLRTGFWATHANYIL